MFGGLKLELRWNFEVPHAAGALIHQIPKSPNPKHPQKNLSFRAKTTKFGCLVIWYSYSPWPLEVAIFTQNKWTYKKYMRETKLCEEIQVKWQKIIHVTCYLCCCKHEVAFEKYKLKSKPSKTSFSQGRSLERLTQGERVKKRREMTHYVLIY